jgi:hypothetical protein
MAVLNEIARSMPIVLVMLPGHFFLAGFVPMTVLIDVSRLVVWMIVMLARFFLRHVVLRLTCPIFSDHV